LIRLRSWKAVPKQIRSAVRRAVDLLPEITEIKHNILIALIPADRWVDESWRVVEGHFQETASGNPPRIVVAGLVWDGRDFRSDAYACQWVVRTLMHEIGHYEQFRDGRKTVERGIAKRVDELMRALTEKGWVA
jgi:hypothetical protein